MTNNKYRKLEAVSARKNNNGHTVADSLHIPQRHLDRPEELLNGSFQCGRRSLLKHNNNNVRVGDERQGHIHMPASEHDLCRCMDAVVKDSIVSSRSSRSMHPHLQEELLLSEGSVLTSASSPVRSTVWHAPPKGDTADDNNNNNNTKLQYFYPAFADLDKRGSVYSSAVPRSRQSTLVWNELPPVDTSFDRKENVAAVNVFPDLLDTGKNHLHNEKPLLSLRQSSRCPPSLDTPRQQLHNHKSYKQLSIPPSADGGRVALLPYLTYDEAPRDCGHLDDSSQWRCAMDKPIPSRRGSRKNTATPRSTRKHQVRPGNMFYQRFSDVCVDNLLKDDYAELLGKHGIWGETWMYGS